MSLPSYWEASAMAVQRGIASVFTGHFFSLLEATGIKHAAIKMIIGLADFTVEILLRVGIRDQPHHDMRC